MPLSLKVYGKESIDCTFEIFLKSYDPPHQEIDFLCELDSHGHPQYKLNQTRMIEVLSSKNFEQRAYREEDADKCNYF